MWINEIHSLDVHPTREKGLSWCLHGCRGSTNAATSSEPGAAHGDSHASGRRVRIPYSKYMQIYQYAVCMCIYIYIYDIWYQHVRNKCFEWVTSPKWHVSVLVSLGWWATIVHLVVPKKMVALKNRRDSLFYLLGDFCMMTETKIMEVAWQL